MSLSPKKKMVNITIEVEGKEFKLRVNAMKSFRKAMKIMAGKLKKEFSSMVFKDKNSGLVMTGKEVMGKMEGAIIIMEILTFISVEKPEKTLNKPIVINFVYIFVEK